LHDLPKRPGPGTRLLLLLLIIHAVFFIIACIKSNIYLVDSHEYLRQAVNLKEHGSLYTGNWDELPHNPEFFSRRPFLYSLFILMIKLPFSSDLWILVFQNLLSILNIFGVYLLLKKHRKDLTWPLLIIGTLLLPAQLIYANLVMSEIFFQTCLFWSCFFYIRAYEKLSLQNVLLSQLFLTAALLTKPVMLYFWLPNLFVLFLLVYKQRKWMLLAFSLLLPLTAYIVSEYNRSVTGYFHYSSIKAANMLTYNAGYFVFAKGGQAEADSFHNSTMRKADATATYGERMQVIEKECAKVIKDDPSGYAKLHIAGMFNLMLDPGRFDLYHFLQLPKEQKKGLFHQLNRDGYGAIKEYLSSISWPVFLTLLLVGLWNVLVFLSLLFFVFNRKIPLFVRMLLLILIGYIVMLTGPVGASRFKVPLYPLLLFTLPFFWEQLKVIWGRFSYSKKKSPLSKMPPGPPHAASVPPPQP
jgi:hypothetical protein